MLPISICKGQRPQKSGFLMPGLRLLLNLTCSLEPIRHHAIRPHRLSLHGGVRRKKHLRSSWRSATGGGVILPCLLLLHAREDGRGGGSRRASARAEHLAAFSRGKGAWCRTGTIVTTSRHFFRPLLSLSLVRFGRFSLWLRLCGQMWCLGGR